MLVKARAWQSLLQEVWLAPTGGDCHLQEGKRTEAAPVNPGGKNVGQESAASVEEMGVLHRQD